MKYDEFAFLNQQLAAMLRDGIPLEGALRQLCTDLRGGPLRSELEKLEADLAKGTPLGEALAARRLPELYTHMIQVGVQSNDLPGVLTLLADYYQRLNVMWTRLKGLMVYPVLVLLTAFALCYFISFFFAPQLALALEGFTGSNGPTHPELALVSLWAPPVFVTLCLGALLVMLLAPPARRAARWRLPAFKESSLARVASAMAVMLKSGVPLGDALTLTAQLEQGTCAGVELAQWRQRLAAGAGKFAEMAAGAKTFPPMFVWLVTHGGEDLPKGFQRAAEVFQARASYRAELLLYAALPCSVLVLGAMIACQVYPLATEMVRTMNVLGDF